MMGGDDNRPREIDIIMIMGVLVIWWIKAIKKDEHGLLRRVDEHRGFGGKGDPHSWVDVKLQNSLIYLRTRAIWL
jgi:hypothetical protein